MAIFGTLAIMNKDGKVKAVFPRLDGGANMEKLLYKYYRTPERINALMDYGCKINSIGIRISKRELDPNSKLYNREASLLPLHIGFDDKDFYQEVGFYDREEEPSYYSSIQLLELEALRDGYYESSVFIYDENDRQWYYGFNKKPLRQLIIHQFDEEPDCDEDEYYDERFKLINQLDEIDEYINLRDNGNYLEGMEDLDPEVLSKYNELVLLARKKGIAVTGCTYEVMNTSKRK